METLNFKQLYLESKIAELMKSYFGDYFKIYKGMIYSEFGYVMKEYLDAVAMLKDAGFTREEIDDEIIKQAKEK